MIGSIALFYLIQERRKWISSIKVCRIILLMNWWFLIGMETSSRPNRLDQPICNFGVDGTKNILYGTTLDGEDFVVKNII